MSDAGLLLTATVAAVATLVLEWPVLRWLRHREVLDTPDHRSSHTVPVPRGGGIALVAGACASALVTAADVGPVAWLLVAVVAFSALGLADDLIHLTAAFRLIGQLLLGAASGAVLLVALDDVSHAPWLVVCAAILALPSAVNAVNFMDGIDGITGLNAAVSGVLVGVAAQSEGQFPLAVVGVAIAGAGLGFLPWNMVRARVFPGDVGSYGVGAAVGICCLGIWATGGGVLASIAPLVLYFADTAAAILAGLRQGTPVHQPHRRHVYQRLVDLGWGHPAAALLVAAASALAGGLLLVASRGAGSVPLEVGAAVIVLGGYLAMPAILERRGWVRQGGRP